MKFSPPGVAVLIVIAYGLDLVLGDPRGWPHPVVIIGKAISFLEKKLRRFFKNPSGELVAGVLLVSIIVSFVFLFSREIIFQCTAWNNYPGYLISIYFLYTAFSLRSLGEHILAIELPLKEGDLSGARRALSFIVGRDTEGLTEVEVSRAALESLAENTGDGVVAPLFYAFLGGPPLALAYKAVNTMDSMLGYRNERYFYFGWAAAKLDDLANLIPARLTAFLFLVAALVGRKLSLLQAAKHCANILQEGKRHFSPNSGYPEAAAAFLLDVQLGGRSIYNGVSLDRPVINAPGRDPSGSDLELLRVLVQRVARLALVAGVILSWLAGVLL